MAIAKDPGLQLRPDQRIGSKSNSYGILQDLVRTHSPACARRSSSDTVVRSCFAHRFTQGSSITRRGSFSCRESRAKRYRQSGGRSPSATTPKSETGPGEASPFSATVPGVESIKQPPSDLASTCMRLPNRQNGLLSPQNSSQRSDLRHRSRIVGRNAWPRRVCLNRAQDA